MGLVDRIKGVLWRLVSKHYDFAVVYGGPDGNDVVFEGELWVCLNGWILLENGDQLSPNAVHRIEDQTFPSPAR